MPAVEAPSAAGVSADEDPVRTEGMRVWAVSGRVLGPEHGGRVAAVSDMVPHWSRTGPAPAPAAGWIAWTTAPMRMPWSATFRRSTI